MVLSLFQIITYGHGHTNNLRALEEWWNKKNRNKPFPQPRQYGSPSSDGYIAVINPFKFGWVNPTVRTPTLLRLMGWFTGYGHCLPAWHRSRTISSLASYKPPSSSSVDALRSVLDEAPMSPFVSIRKGHGRSKGGCDRYLHEDYDGFTERSSYSWAEGYRDLVFQALIDVIKEHGLGDDGWKSVRWEVFDKVRLILFQFSHRPLSRFDGAQNALAVFRMATDVGLTVEKVG